MRDIPIDDNNQADRVFCLALRMAIDGASADHIAANVKLDEAKQRIESLTKERDALYEKINVLGDSLRRTEAALCEREAALRERIAELNAGSAPITALYRRAEEARDFLNKQKAPSKTERVEMASYLGTALLVAEKHVDLIPF